MPSGYIARVSTSPIYLMLNVLEILHLQYVSDFYTFVAFMCVVRGKPITIGRKILAQYVCYAEDIADVSYSQAETFSSALFSGTTGQQYACSKPKLPVRVKVIQALIRSSGKVVNVRTIVKNIRDRATEIIKGICHWLHINVSNVTLIF